MTRTLVIAEIGSCHDGSLDQALALIHAAAECGADVAKAQFWSSASRMAERRHAPKYEPIYQRYQVPESWLPVLRTACHQHGLQFACASYLPEDVQTVAQYADILKIASFEANDRQLLTAHRDVRRPMMVSLGLEASRAFVREFIDQAQYLHCVSAYPAPLDALNLARIRELGGYSDHSGDIRVGGWAVASGARIIEAHLRLDETDNDNLDAGPHALCPAAFEAYVRDIRDVEQAMSGTGTEDAETAMSQYVVR